MKFKSYFVAIAIAASASQAFAAHNQAGAVFSMTNSAEKNEILRFARASNGTLTLEGSTLTEGRGSGGTTDPLGSQGSLTLSSDHHYLFAVNAGSGSISTFSVNGSDLNLIDVTPSGGAAPVSVAANGDLVYVLNFGGNSSVVGFKQEADGHLHKIANSISYLSTSNSGASSVVFSADGKWLIATEKLTNNIDVFPVNADGTLGTRVATVDPSKGLFDVAVTPDGAVLSLETGNSTITSFQLETDGALLAVGNPVATAGAASCWSVITPDGKWVYIANAGSSTISGFSIGSSESLTPVTGTIAGTLPAGSTDLDLAVSADSKYLYSVDSGTGSIGMFKINSNGLLTSLSQLGAFVAASGANGIAAY